MPTQKSSNKPLRIGFDLDGVILYNPVRIQRPIAAFVKEKILKRKGVKFYIPKTRMAKMMWWLAHKTSFMPAPGLDEILKLIDTHKIEAYIITARFGTLKKDFENWMKKINAEKYFKGYFYNPGDEQPHLFKKRKIQELDLDLFIEDNWDIVNFLHHEFKERDIIWITNIFDKTIAYPHKYSSLKDVVTYIKDYRLDRIPLITNLPAEEIGAKIPLSSPVTNL